ncbi:MAG: type III polyketide synthase [Burkholderiales bacterium]
MYLSGIGTAVPVRRYTQIECWDAVRRAPQFRGLSARSKATLQGVLLNAASGIDARHLALAQLDEAFDLEPDALAARYVRHAPALAAAAGRSALNDAGLSPHEVDAVVVSTCTGYLCPGLTSYMSEALGLRADALGLDLVGQGCGAALPNLRTAEALIAAGRCAHVLSICVEVCIAAFYIDDDMGVLISACIFGDGAGAVVLASDAPEGKRRVEWRGAWSSTDPAERDTLRFEARGGMLRNILAPEVPALAGERAAALLERALGEAGVARRDIRYWIWHAGGKRVLDRLRDAAGLEPADVEPSARVLREYGNLSSPFVLFVLEAALRERAPGGCWWLSSFGAGFSCHGALLRVSA